MKSEGLKAPVIFPDVRLYHEVPYSRKCERFCYKKVQKVRKQLFCGQRGGTRSNLRPSDSMAHEMTSRSRVKGERHTPQNDSKEGEGHLVSRLEDLELVKSKVEASCLPEW